MRGATRVLWWLALGWCGLLAIGAAVAPVYTESTMDDSGVETLSHATLLQAEPGATLAILAVPVAFVLAIGWAVRARRRWSLRTAWFLWALLAVLNLLAMLSVGIFMVPLTALLLAVVIRSTPPWGPPLERAQARAA